MTVPATLVPQSSIVAAAARLTLAQETGVPCVAVRDLIGADDVLSAYAVQQEITAARLAAGAVVVGRKIGLTSEAVQRQMGVAQPDFGILFDDMVFADGGTIPRGFVLQPRVEAEIAFVLDKDLADGPLDIDQVRGAIAYAAAAIEVCGSRIAQWDISFGDTVADNASSGAYVLGGIRRTLDEFDPVAAQMHMTVTGAEDSVGTGVASLGDPLNAVTWLARQARELGEPLRAGQVVLSGALGPMRAVTPGAEVRVSVTGLGTVSVRFEEDVDAVEQQGE